MNVEINNHRKIGVIQKQFNDCFQNLKIEFHEKSNKRDGSPSLKFVKSSNKTLADCRTLHNEGFITVTELMNTGYLKQRFRDDFGLMIEIFQRTGHNTWRTANSNEHIILNALNSEAEYLTPSS